MSHEDTVRGFIIDDLGWPGPAGDLTADYDLLENDVVDSLGILRLVTLIEEHFDVEIPDDQLVPENFVSLRALASLIEPLVVR
jgi:acyl carrier protein